MTLYSRNKRSFNCSSIFLNLLQTLISRSMRNLSIFNPFSFCFFFLLYHLSIATSTPRYIAVDDITLNCGSSGNSTAQDKRVWIGDINSESVSIEEPYHKSLPSTSEQEDYFDAVPYKTARISFSQFTYQFRVSPGPKFLRLYFFNASYQGFDNSKDFFTVKAGSFVLLSNFSASLANSSNEGVTYKEFCINVGEERQLNLMFIPWPINSSKFYAFINGIEIVSMPNSLYDPKGGDFDLFSQFSFDDQTALEMIVRLNVGGGDIQPVDDTGMFRKWSQDDGYFLGRGLNPHVLSMKPRYSIIPNYTAPDDVYKTAVTVDLNKAKNRVSNLTWRLTVDSGFDYLVRLHFCEIDPDITGAGERIFKIYIDNQIHEAWADVFEWGKGNETPVYQDYLARVQDKELVVVLVPIVPVHGIISAILNGMEVFKLNNSVGNLAVAGPLPSLPQTQKPESKAKKTVIIATGTCLGILVVLTLACGMVLWKLRKTKRKVSFCPLSKCWCWPEPDKGKSTRTTASSLPGELCRHFLLEEIKRATENFKDELIIGVGGFGKVYKGLVDEGTMIVALKRLNPESKQGFREFWTEIEMLSQLRHVHLVSLIGYCNEEGEMILVYDFMANGTLRDHLYGTHNGRLSWKQRLQICVGAARGLDYLHTGVKQPIIHRDVKTTNILLDDKWVAKVSDFGLSKTGQENTAVSTMVKGTFGYLDPDYAKRRQLTAKSDVYSFGVVLLEALCARKALDQKLETPQWNLANWARECIASGTIGEIIDPYLKGKIAPECFKVYIEVAESCVRDQGMQRPTMNDVKEKLEFALELQERADAEMEKIKAIGQYSYPDVISFPVTGTIGVFRNNNVQNEHGLETDSGTVFGSTNIRLTSSSLDSDAIVDEHVFTATTNSKP